MNHNAFEQMVAQLAPPKMENEILRMSLVRALSLGSPMNMMSKQVPYAWIFGLLVGLNSFGDALPDSAEHPLAKFIRQMVNEETRAKRQGRESAVPGLHIILGSPQGVLGHGQMMMGNHNPLGNCFKYGGT